MCSPPDRARKDEVMSKERTPSLIDMASATPAGGTMAGKLARLMNEFSDTHQDIEPITVVVPVAMSVSCTNPPGPCGWTGPAESSLRPRRRLELVLKHGLLYTFEIAARNHRSTSFKLATTCVAVSCAVSCCSILVLHHIHQLPLIPAGIPQGSSHVSQTPR